LKKCFLNPLYDCWKSVSSTLPATLLKLTHNFLSGLFASKKKRNASTDGVWPRQWQRIGKALTNAQLLGCSWARETFTSVRSARSKRVKGNLSPTLRKTIE